VLDPEDAAAVATRFGATDEQVRRDHLVAHLLAAVAALDIEGLVFFGGTALSLTHLPDGRLSEDIDLYGPSRGATAVLIEAEVPRALRREYPRSRWDPPLRAVRANAAARLVTEDDLAIRVQLLDVDVQSWRRVPTERWALERRYADVPVTTMSVPTRAAFAAMKAAAWVDRHAARDLFDLAALTAAGALDADARRLFRQLTGRQLRAYDFPVRPLGDWQVQLAHQTRDLPAAEDCLAVVRTALAKRQ
jgi:Nucleotidyl transferase AbiEii toxin, Type IV TA system